MVYSIKLNCHIFCGQHLRDSGPSAAKMQKHKMEILAKHQKAQFNHSKFNL